MGTTATDSAYAHGSLQMDASTAQGPQFWRAMLLRPPASSLPSTCAHTHALFTFTAAEICCFLDDPPKLNALTFPLITFWEAEVGEHKL